MTERVCIFIDGANFHYQCKENLGRTDIDLGAFAAWLVGPSRLLVRTYYYTVPLTAGHPVEAQVAQHKFFGALDRVPYLEVRLGKLVQRDTICRNCGTSERKWVEKGVDMWIGIDMLVAAARNIYDTAVLVSGDGDLAEAVKAVKGVGLHVEVAAFPKARAYDLMQATDVCRDLTSSELRPFLIRLAGI